MKKTLLAVLVAAALTLISCTSTPPAPPAGVDCVAACERIGPNDTEHPSGLGCSYGGVQFGEPCEVWMCTPSTSGESPMTPERSSCISHAPSCNQARECR